MTSSKRSNFGEGEIRCFLHEKVFDVEVKNTNELHHKRININKNFPL